MSNLRGIIIPLISLFVVHIFYAQQVGGTKIWIQEFVRVIEWDQMLVNLSFENNDDGILINGDFENLVELNDEYKVKMTIEFAMDDESGEFKGPFTILDDEGVCFVLDTFYRTYMYDSVKKYSPNAPQPDTCPLPAQKYILDNYPMNIDGIMNITELHIDLYLQNDEELLAHYILVAEVVD